MTTEQQEGPVPLRRIAIDLQEHSITFETDGQAATRLTLTSAGVLYQLLGSPLITERSVDQLTTPARDDVAALAEDPLPIEPDTAKQRNPTVALTGRLKSQPKEGRPDNQGHPTAWATFAAHEEESERGHLYSATFHRASRRIALSLAVNDQITVEGYAHPSGDPTGKRLDTLSVFRLLNYPGKPEHP
jgi:hypothetical protein